MTMTRRKIVQLAMAAVVVLCAAVCFIVLQTCHRYHFCYQEQTQLFLCSVDFAHTYFSAPAWLACLVGDYLTQFYYYTFAGPAILTVWLVVLGVTLFASLRKGGVGSVVAFAVALVVAVAVLFFCFSERYRLSSVIALAGGAAAFLLVPGRGGMWVRAACAFVLGVVAFWAFGNGVILFAVLTLLHALFAWRERWALVVAAAAALAVVPCSARVYNLPVGGLYAYPGVGSFTLPSLAVEGDLAVVTEYGLGNKSRVVSMVAEADAPSRLMKFYYNLVMAERGLLPDVLLKWPDNYLGTFSEISAETPILVTYSLPDLYWALGDMTHTERAAMLANVFSPGNRNVKMTKRLAEVNLVAADRPAANKYLRLLSQTRVYRHWSDALLRGEPKAMRPYAEKAILTNLRDTITTGQNMHTIMMQILDSNPRNTVALDYALCSLLQLKDLTNFKRDYDRYCMSTGMPRPKKLYQEALCICLAGSGAPEDEWRHYITDGEVFSRFRDYSHQRGSSMFADTYWYYFDKAPRMNAK